MFPEESINYPAVDAICIGEGEIALNEYLHSLENGQDPVVLGIWAKDRQGRIQRNPLRPFNQCLDDLPFPNWEHWQIGEHLQRNLYFIPGAIKFLASRGCPYSCTFCSNEAIRQAIPGNYYRQRTPQSVIQEIQVNACKYGGRGFKIIHFADEIFGLHYDFLEDFCRLFKQENLDKQFKWCCATRPDILTPLWAKTAASAGCIWVWLGIESGDEYIRNHVYQKNISQEQITQAAVYLRNQGIAFSFSMMAGCPQDTQASILKGVQLINRLDPEAFDYSVYQPLPKTRLGSVAAQAMPREDFTASWQPDTPRLCTQTLSRADLKQIMWRIRLVKLRRFLRAGFKAKRFIFFLDIMKYLFSIKGCRVIPLSSPSLAMDLQLKTIFKYTAEAQAKLYKNN